MEMISNTTQRFCVQVAADRRNVGVHPRPNVAVQPRLAIFGAEDNMNDDLAKRLRHCGIIAEKHAQVNRAVSASEFIYENPGALPQASINIAPLALNRYEANGFPYSYSAAALAASLARAAFGANPARASPDDLIAAAMRTDDVHEHVAERFLYPIGVAGTVRSRLRIAFVRKIARHDIDQLSFRRSGQIRHRPIQRLFFHFGNFL